MVHFQNNFPFENPLYTNKFSKNYVEDVSTFPLRLKLIENYDLKLLKTKKNQVQIVPGVNNFTLTFSFIDKFSQNDPTLNEKSKFEKEIQLIF